MLKPLRLSRWSAPALGLLLLAVGPAAGESAGGPEPFKKMDGGVQLQERPASRRLGTLSGRFRSSDPGARLPAAVTLRILQPLLPYPGRQPKRRLFRCPLAENGAWGCLLPAATYDLAVGAEGFVPQRRKAVAVRAGRDHDLGRFELEPSQAITGWLAVEGGAIEAERILLRVVPTGEIGHPTGPVYQGDPMLIERTVRSDGSFRISNVRPGTWNVEVRSAGYVAALGTPVRVVAGKDAVFGQALVLHRPFDLEVAVEPPLDAAGRPWRLSGGPIRTLARGLETRVPKALQPVGEGKGLYRLPRQGPGRYWFAVHDPEDNVFVSRSDLEIRDPSEARLVIRVPVLEVEGRVTLGARPIRGSLLWNDPEGTISFRAETDEEGRFRARMPGPGLYRFQIFGDSGPPLRIDGQVEEDRPGHATLDLRLPATRVFGRVVEEDGRSGLLAGVYLSAAGFSEQMATREDGTFEAEGMPAGRLELRATFGGTDPDYPLRASDVLTVEVKEGASGGPVVLRLRPSTELRGRVVDERGRNPESQVSLQALLEDDTPVFARTAPDGSFTLDVPASSEGVTVLVKPLEGGLRALDLRLSDPPPTVTVEAEPGLVRVALGAAWGRVRAGGQTIEIEQDGVRIPFGPLDGWATERGAGGNRDDARSLAFPALAPGRYRVCLGREIVHGRIDPATRRRGGLDCDEGELAPGGELALSLP